MASNEDQIRSNSMRFESVSQADVPKGRDGKHKQIITQLLSDIEQLKVGSALKVPLADLPDSKENIRSALSRAAAQRNLHIATSSNDEFLFVWKTRPSQIGLRRRTTKASASTSSRPRPGAELSAVRSVLEYTREAGAHRGINPGAPVGHDPFERDFLQLIAHGT